MWRAVIRYCRQMQVRVNICSALFAQGFHWNTHPNIALSVSCRNLLTSTSTVDVWGFWRGRSTHLLWRPVGRLAVALVLLGNEGGDRLGAAFVFGANRSPFLLRFHFLLAVTFRHRSGRFLPLLRVKKGKPWPRLEKREVTATSCTVLYFSTWWSQSKFI